MITPISNVSFNIFRRMAKVKKDNSLNFGGYEKNLTLPLSNISFRGYYDIKPQLSMEYALKHNFFKLPKIKDRNGNEIQIMPDDSQMECAKNILDNKTVLFDAPTGMGKTSVAHFAINKNLYEGKKSIYTVPIKALANDKYREFSSLYGEENVGILTGDRKINPKAPIVIMTTEIFSNQSQDLNEKDKNRIGTVIFDEIHNIDDEQRGIAWEYSIINAAQAGIQILGLSATIGNADKLSSWMGKIKKSRPSVRVNVPASDRPVPLHWYIYRKDKHDAKLSDVMHSEINLRNDFKDGSNEIINLIFDSEKTYYDYRRENEIYITGKYNGFVVDESYRKTIREKLELMFGANWIDLDFSSDEIREKLTSEFQSITELELDQIKNLAFLSSSKSLSDAQKKALEIIYKKVSNAGLQDEMTDNDYIDAYKILKKRIGKGSANFIYSSEDFRARLKREFKSLTSEEINTVSSLLSSSNSKNIRMLHEPWREEDYVALIQKLNTEKMLPAIIFKLSQGACEQVANIASEFDCDEYSNDEINNEQVKNIEKSLQRVDLTTQDEKEQIQKIIDEYQQNGVYFGPSFDKSILLKGWAVHHAGKQPQYKELVEELFKKKLLKVVVATSTLGAGINMPAKTAVITNTVYGKYDEKLGYQIQALSANEFHQMAGRAGRRGIDNVGNVVFYNLHTPNKGFKEGLEPNKKGKVDELWLAYNLLASDANDLRSSFRPQAPYLAKYYMDSADDIGIDNFINSSFRLFLAKDKDKIKKQIKKKFEKLSQALLKLNCLSRSNGTYKTTSKGEILAQAQGMNPLLLCELLYGEKLAKLNPVQLCELVACIQTSSDEPEGEDTKQMVSQIICNMGLTDDKNIDAVAFESALAVLKNTENKVLKPLRESMIDTIDIKTCNSFGALVGYLFANLNESNPDDSINNYEKILFASNLSCDVKNQANAQISRMATEGNVYKIITGSISTLKQIVRICDSAISQKDKYPNTSYWLNLKEKAQDAIKLLDKDPINNEPNYASKS